MNFKNTEKLQVGDLSQKTRMENYARFIQSVPMRDSFDSVVLDIGEANWVSQELAKRFNLEIEQTLPVDFNYSLETLQSKYLHVFCFEVIEHLMNPLHFLRNVRAVMDKDGTLWLSTPVGKFFNVMMCDEHLTQYQRNPLVAMFRESGFYVSDETTFRPFPWWFYFTGIRPPFKFFTHEIQLYKLRKL